MKKLLIGSLQYSPIYKSHCCALGKECEKNGYQVRYLFSNEYKWMLSNDIMQKTIFIGNSKDILSSIKNGLNLKIIFDLNQVLINERPNYVYMYNYHPFLNYYLALFSRKNKIKFIQHVQEPYVENKHVYKGLKQYWLYLFELFQGMLLSKTDTVVLSSQEALNLFDKRYKGFRGNKFFIPLLYEDIGDTISSSSERKYVTFIGPPVPTKSPEIFLKIIDYSNEFNLNLDFLMISRNKIDDPSYSKDNLMIFYKDRISDEEIGHFLKCSLMTITPYRVATQSSVILTSYMYGTPVISTDIGGLPEVVHPLETGYLVSIHSDIDKWIEGMEYIISNLNNMSDNCRSYFEKEFSGNNWDKYIDKIFMDCSE